MSRPKKTPPPPPPPVPAAKRRAQRKSLGAKAKTKGAEVTAEAVATRLLALPQTEGTTPKLWRKADFGGELSRAEKECLDAALARLQADRRLVALSHKKAVFYAFLDAFLSPVSPASPESPTEDLMAVYRRLVRESGGFPDVKIALLARGVGPAAARGLPERLRELWSTGDATLSLGDWSLANEETRAAAVEMDGEKYLLVRIEEA